MVQTVALPLDLHPVPRYGLTVETMSAEAESWAPQACTLPTVERPVRVAEFDGLFATAVRAVERSGRTRLVLDLEPRPDVAATAAGLVVRETECCSFFTFGLTATGGRLTLEIAVPDAQTAVLDALEARAAS
jgi:hypothetical protein